MRVDREPAFVLHTRAYRETSQLVDVFSRRHGRLRVVAKGVRGGSSKQQSQKKLIPFTPLLLSWSGKGDLKTLLSAESVAGNRLLQGDRLYSGFYLNELLMRLLAEYDPHESLYDHYQQAVSQLSQETGLEALLRNFELRLLEEIGYELVLDRDVESGESVRAEAWYWYDPHQGIVEQQGMQPSGQKNRRFKGENLLAIAEHNFAQSVVLKDAKHLLRLALKSHLGDKPLHSRELFRAVESR